VIAQLDRNYVKIAKSRVLVRLLSYGLFEGRPATTRGQWWNPAVAAHLRLAARAASGRPPDRPIFVLGIGRSGTTLLGRLLAVHPDVGFLNEPKAMWHLIDSVEDVSGVFNHSATAYMRRSGSDVTPEMRTRANQLYGYYERLTRSQRIVDKYCELSYRRDYLRALFPDCMLIAIVRRPQAVVRSIEQWSAVHGSPTEDWWGVENRKWEVICDTLLVDQPDAAMLLRLAKSARGDADRAILEWVIGMRELLSPRPHTDLDLLIRYEDLVADPGGEMNRTLAAVGLPPSAEVERMAGLVVHEDTRTHTVPDDVVPGELRGVVDDLLAALGYTP
jgi:Sulfotransferase family